jgi:hypothetical protein
VVDPSRARVTGPLQPYAAGFAAELARLGYASGPACGQMFLMAHVSRWLAGEGLDAGGLTPEAAGRFLAARRAAGYTRLLSPKGLAPLSPPAERGAGGARAGPGGPGCGAAGPLPALPGDRARDRGRDGRRLR